MKKIKELNEILKKYFMIDISDDNTARNCIEIKQYLTMKLTLEEILNTIYGSDIEIISEVNVIDKIPSKIEKLIDKNKSNPELIISLSDLGYENVNIKYFVKKNTSGKKIFIGTYKHKIKKYLHPLTEVGYMNKIEEIFNISLIPNIDHTKLTYGTKRIAPYTSEVVLKDATSFTELKTKTGIIICKNLDCDHKNGYSTDEHLPNNVNIEVDYLKNEICGDLVDIPNDVKKDILYGLEKIIKTKEDLIINEIIAIIIDKMGKRIIEMDNKFLKDSHENVLLFNLEPMISLCKELGIDVLNIEQNSLQNFLVLLELKKQEVVSEYNEKITSVRNTIEQEKLYCEMNSEIMEEADEYMNRVYNSTDPIGYEIISITEDLCCEFIDILSQKSKSIDRLGELLKIVKDGINVIDSLPSCELCSSNFDTIKSMYLPSEPAKDLVTLIEKNIGNCNKIISFVPTNTAIIYDYEEEQKTIINQYDYLIFLTKEVLTSLTDCFTTKEELISFINIFKQLDSICAKNIIQDSQYENIEYRINSFESLYNGDLLNKDSYNGKQKIINRVVPNAAVTNG